MIFQKKETCRQDGKHMRSAERRNTKRFSEHDGVLSFDEAMKR